MSWTLPATAGAAAGAVVLVGCTPGVRSCMRSRKVSSLYRHKISNDEKGFEKWSALDLSAWLIQRGVSSEAALMFLDENVDGLSFTRLEGEHLKELGITKLGDRMRIESLQKLLQSDDIESSTTTPSSVVRTNPLRPHPTAESDSLSNSAQDRQIAEVVASHKQSLQKMKNLVASEGFLNASVREKKIQLQKVNSLLTKLLEFASQIPEQHGIVLLKEIQDTHEFVTANSLKSLPTQRTSTKKELIAEASKKVRSGELSGEEALMELRNLVTGSETPEELAEIKNLMIFLREPASSRAPPPADSKLARILAIKTELEEHPERAGSNMMNELKKLSSPSQDSTKEELEALHDVFQLLTGEKGNPTPNLTKILAIKKQLIENPDTASKEEALMQLKEFISGKREPTPAEMTALQDVFSLIDGSSKAESSGKLTRLLAIKKQITEDPTSLDLESVLDELNEFASGKVKPSDDEMAVLKSIFAALAGEGDEPETCSNKMKKIAQIKKDLLSGSQSGIESALLALKSIVSGEEQPSATEMAALNEVFAIIRSIKNGEPIEDDYTDAGLKLLESAKQLQKGIWEERSDTSKETFLLQLSEKLDNYKATPSFDSDIATSVGNLLAVRLKELHVGITPIQKLMQASTLLSTDFSQKSISDQQQSIETVTALLKEYTSTPEHDEAIASKMKELLSVKIEEHSRHKEIRELEGSPDIEGAIDTAIKRLSCDEFSELEMPQQFVLLENAYAVIDGLSQSQLAIHHEKTALLLDLLKKRQKTITQLGNQLGQASGEASNDEEEEEEERDETAANKLPVGGQQAGLRILPLLKDRLTHPEFSNDSSDFEYQMILWLLAQCSESLRVSLTPDDFKKVMQPVHSLFMKRMGECSELPKRKAFDRFHRYSYNPDIKTFTLAENDGNTPTDSVSVSSPLVKEAQHQTQKTLNAIIVSIDSTCGLESVEVQYLSYVLKQKLGYNKVITLTGEDSTAEILDQAISDIPDISLVLIRTSSSDDPTMLTFPETDHGESEMPLSWIKNKLPPSTCIIVDSLASCLVTTGGSDSSEIVMDSNGLHGDVPTTCSWLFDGFFTPLITEALFNDPPRTVSELVHAVITMSGGEAAPESGAEISEFDACLVSFGEREDDQGEEEEEEVVEENSA